MEAKNNFRNHLDEKCELVVADRSIGIQQVCWTPGERVGTEAEVLRGADVEHLFRCLKEGLKIQLENC